MTDRSVPERIGLFGGTFDPIHLGHLQIASQLKEKLQLDEMRLVLAAKPALREAPGATPEQRWQMLQLALHEYPELVGDDRELRRAGTSYSYDTVAEIREKFGESVAIAFCVGWDSLVSLPHWHQWQGLLDRCAIVVVNRPYHDAGETPLHPILEERLRTVSSKPKLSPGEILEVEFSPLPISATRIRESISTGNDIPSAWLTSGVADYIKQNRLYGLQ